MHHIKNYIIIAATLALCGWAGYSLFLSEFLGQVPEIIYWLALVGAAPAIASVAITHRWR